MVFTSSSFVSRKIPVFCIRYAIFFTCFVFFTVDFMQDGSSEVTFVGSKSLSSKILLTLWSPSSRPLWKKLKNANTPHYVRHVWKNTSFLFCAFFLDVFCVFCRRIYRGWLFWDQVRREEERVASCFYILQLITAWNWNSRFITTKKPTSELF